METPLTFYSNLSRCPRCPKSPSYCSFRLLKMVVSTTSSLETGRLQAPEKKKILVKLVLESHTKGNHALGFKGQTLGLQVKKDVTFFFIKDCDREQFNCSEVRLPSSATDFSSDDFYRTQVYLGSDLWVLISLTHSKTILQT